MIVELRAGQRGRLRRLLILIPALMLLGACQAGGTISSTATPKSVNFPVLLPTLADAGEIAPRATPDLAQLPLLAAHLQRVQTALSQPIPILTLTEGLDEAQTQAQKLAVNDSRFQGYLRDQKTQAPLRNEVFGVYPLRASDITPQIAACATNPCYRVELYNYAMNFYLAAVVDLKQNAVLNVFGFENTQPDIPDALTQIAIEIATNSPEVKHTLENSSQTKGAIMANTKTALNGTVCERARHLCVAPTFVVGDQALWAIVDLTDGRLVGTRWTDVGRTRSITEKELQNDSILRHYCQQETALEQDGWRMNYMLTSSDGLRISGVSFQDVPILQSAKLVDWHVSYSVPDGFGYSDAVGCPVFSQAAVIAVQPPSVEPIEVNGEVVGFALKQEFWSELWPQPCNYFYAQRYEFYRDGRFRPVVMSVGRGCGDNGTYRPVTRIAFADGNYTFSQWNGMAWDDWQHEDWRLAADVPATTDGYQFRLRNAAGGYYIEPGIGQFGDGGRGDNAFMYITLHHTDRDEGDADMPTIGPCCNTDYQQGPEKFINATPEPISDSPLVMWYVAQLHNDDTPGAEYCWAETVPENGLYIPREYPCLSGPMFVPLTAVSAP
jgi:hypothetical protein